MDTKTPSDFGNHDEWLAHVRENVPAAGQYYALACGRTALFKSFYEVRRQSFPVEFTEELEQLKALCEPERTIQLESLNQRIFTSLTELMFNRTQTKGEEVEAVALPSPREQIQTLLNHLVQKNPYFSLWTAYKNRQEGNPNADDWEHYLREELGPESEDDIAFSRAMGDLDKLLLHFLDRDLSLPKYFFERCWFLDYLRGPERMLQTRALLNTLTGEMEACASA